MQNRIRKTWPLWDIPTRLTHGLLIAALILAWWSAETQRPDLHQWAGYSILVLVLARIVWGFIGSTPSLFSTFLKSPQNVWRYLFDRTQNKPSIEHARVTGHNPAGGWSVLVLLVLLFVQSVTGLFNSDDILFNGPFYHLLESDWQDRAGVIHDYAFDVLIAFIALHIVAVFFHYWRGRNLLLPMLRGKTQDCYSDQPPKASWRWLLVLLIFAAALWAAVQSAPQPTTQWF